MRRLSGFSLMEMMIVLLIVAVVAAASAPMINKKLMSNASERSPWVWTGTDRNIAFNLDSDQNTRVTIGTINPPNGINSVLHLNGNLSLTDNNNRNYLLDTADSSLVLTNSGVYDEESTIFGSNAEGRDVGATVFGRQALAAFHAVAVGDNARASANSTTIGTDAEALNGISIGQGVNSRHAYAIGDSNTVANGPGGIAFGSNAIAGNSNPSDSSGSIVNAIAIGNMAQATESNTIAIGKNAKATAKNSIAIGYQCYATGENSILIANHDELGYDNTIQLGSSYDNALQVYFGKKLVFKNNSLVTSSDKRLKNIEKEFLGGLSEIKKLKVYNYTFKNDKDQPRIGIIAQDLKKILPNAVLKDNKGYYLIRQEDILYTAINAIKELANNFDVQAKKIKELEKQNTDLLKRIEALEKKVK